MSDLTDDLFDRYVFDGEDDEPAIVECRHCGKGGLHWEQTDEGLRLYDGRDRKHVCNAAKVHSIVADDFDDLTQGDQHENI